MCVVQYSTGHNLFEILHVHFIPTTGLLCSGLQLASQWNCLFCSFKQDIPRQQNGSDCGVFTCMVSHYCIAGHLYTCTSSAPMLFTCAVGSCVHTPCTRTWPRDFLRMIYF